MTTEKVIIPWQAKTLYAKESEVYTMEGTLEGKLTSPQSKEKLSIMVSTTVDFCLRKYGSDLFKKEELIEVFKDYIHHVCQELSIVNIRLTHAERSDHTPVLMPNTVNWAVNDVVSEYETTYSGNGSIEGNFPILPQEELEEKVNEAMVYCMGKYGGQYLFTQEEYLEVLRVRIAKNTSKPEIPSDCEITAINVDTLTIDGKPVNFSNEDTVC